MIHHIVLIRFKLGVLEEEINDIFEDLHRIKDEVPGILSITSGKSESPEKIERGYMHGFIVEFADWASLEAYQVHPQHKRLGGRIVSNAIGGLDGVLVFDLPIAEPAQ